MNCTQIMVTQKAIRNMPTGIDIEIIKFKTLKKNIKKREKKKKILFNFSIFVHIYSKKKKI